VLSKLRDVVSIPVCKKDYGFRPIVYEDAIESHAEFAAELNALVAHGGQPPMVIKGRFEG
jgi:hypothetical protein